MTYSTIERVSGSVKIGRPFCFRGNVSRVHLYYRNYVVEVVVVSGIHLVRKIKQILRAGNVRRIKNDQGEPIVIRRNRTDGGHVRYGIQGGRPSWEPDIGETKCGYICEWDS